LDIKDSKLNYLKQLDGVRAIAITLVIIWHYFYQLTGDYSEGPMKYIKFITSWTWSGVDLFFILSGFLIGRILINNKGSENYFKTFYLKRIFRIFPAYYLVLFVYIIFILTGISANFPWLFENQFSVLPYFLFLQNFWMVIYGFGSHWLVVTWTLAVEEQFYLLLPLLIYFVRLKSLPKILITGVILAPVIRALYVEGAYVLLPTRMDSLLSGVLIAYFYLNGSLIKFFSGKQKYLIAVLVALFIFIFNYKRLDYLRFGGVYIQALLVFFYSMSLVFLLTNTNKFLQSLFSNSIMSFIAKISYMLYLTHQIFSGLLHQLILNQSPQLNNYNDIAVTLLSLIVTIVFCTVSYKLLESPFINFGKRYKF